MDVKEPITFEAQLQKLKGRGCIIENEAKAIEVLKNINYYRLTAYFLSFKKDQKTYLEGTTFENVYHISNASTTSGFFSNSHTFIVYVGCVGFELCVVIDL